MTYDAAAFLNSSLAILVGIAVAVVLFATFFPETPAYAARRFRRQLFVHLSYLTSACPCGPALQCYLLALLEQLGATLARVKDEPKLAHECLTSALAALSAAQAIGRLKRNGGGAWNRRRGLPSARPAVADPSQSIRLEIQQAGNRSACA
jgi:uncharacterized membrane protein YccC